jgi:hypothetical protein
MGDKESLSRWPANINCIRQMASLLCRLLAATTEQAAPQIGWLLTVVRRARLQGNGKAVPLQEIVR